MASWGPSCFFSQQHHVKTTCQSSPEPSCCPSSSQNWSWYIATAAASSPKAGAELRDAGLWGPAGISPLVGHVIPERPCEFMPNVLESRAGVSHARGSDSMHRNPEQVAGLFAPTKLRTGRWLSITQRISPFSVQALLWPAKLCRAFIFKCTSKN